LVETLLILNNQERDDMGKVEYEGQCSTWPGQCYHAVVYWKEWK